jgi:hypothetical protein
MENDQIIGELICYKLQLTTVYDWSEKSRGLLSFVLLYPSYK